MGHFAHRRCPLRRLRARLPVAYSCRAHGVCPSCNTRRVETATHLAVHAIPHLPVRQWALSVPKRLRYSLYADPAIQNLGLDILLSAVEQGLRAPCTVVQGSMARVGAVAFIHRFGALLKPRLHFHCVVVDGLFEAGTEAELTAQVAQNAGAERQTTDRHSRQRATSASSIRALTRRGLLGPEAAEEMDVSGSRRWFKPRGRRALKADDRSGLERLRYFARPVFALERLLQIDHEYLVYESFKPGPGGSVSLLSGEFYSYSSKGVHASEVGL